MKTVCLLTLGGFLSLTSAVQSAVIQLPGRIEVSGVLDGSAGIPGVNGDTMDYLTFQVLTTTTVTVTSGFGGNRRLQLAQFIGIEEDGKVPFGFIGNTGPYRLEEPVGPTAFFTRLLDPGVYVAVMGVRDRTSYDIYDGYVPVNIEGGGFIFGPYAYSIDGDVRALEFREGNLDRTFTITVIPEPSTTALFAGSAIWLLHRNASNRKENKALLPTPRGWLVSTLYFIRKCLGFGRAHPRP